MKTIVKNGTIVMDSDVMEADLVIEDGKIASIMREADVSEQDEVIDADGRFVFPGGIDVHTHLAWPSTADDFVTGTKAAAVGGITSIVNYATGEAGRSLIDGLHEWKRKAAGAVIDYGFHSVIIECTEELLAELPVLAEREGVTSIKLFMAYKGELMVADSDMYKLMKKAGQSGILTNVHAENGDLIDELIAEALSQSNTAPVYHAYTRPPSLEAEATGRAIAIAELAGAPLYVVHVSCAEALERVDEARRRSSRIYAETCPHYLVLDQSELERPGFEGGKYVCSPPLREKGNGQALWRGIESGLISTVASDHNSYLFEGHKSRGRDNFADIPNGVPGIEDMFSLLYHYGVHERRIALTKFVEMIASGPARMFGLHPDKGSIRVGADADLVLLDPKRTRTITQAAQHQNLDYNLYEGTEVHGVITHVWSRGELIAREGRFVGSLGRGRYLHRRKFG